MLHRELTIGQEALAPTMRANQLSTKFLKCNRLLSLSRSFYILKNLIVPSCILIDCCNIEALSTTLPLAGGTALSLSHKATATHTQTLNAVYGCVFIVCLLSYIMDGWTDVVLLLLLLQDRSIDTSQCLSCTTRSEIRDAERKETLSPSKFF